MLLLPKSAWATDGGAHAEGGSPASTAHEGAVSAEGGHPGMDWSLVGLQASNFILFLLVIFFAARRPVLDALGNRANVVRRDLDESQQVKAAAERQYAEVEEKLAGLERRIEEMKVGAIREAEAEAVRIHERAQADAVRIRDTAQRTVREEALRARNEIRREVVEQAASLAGAIVKQNVSSEDQARLHGELLSALQQPAGGVA